MLTQWLLIGAGVLLTFGTAVFVAAEFSLVALDPAHVDESRRGGKRVRRALRTLSTQLSGAQVGITLTTILLGYTAQPAIAELLRLSLTDSVLSRAAVGTVAGVVSMIIVNVFSMVFGELVPKNSALANPMGTAAAVSPLMMAFTAALKPIIVGLNNLANVILRLFGIQAKEELSGGRSRQELAALVRRSAEAGTLDVSTALLLKNTIDLDDLTAVNVMTDRTRMQTVEHTDDASAVLEKSRHTGYSRFPVVGPGGLDDIIGLVHMRQALILPRARREQTPVTDIMVPISQVPETLPMRPLLLELRGLGSQCAIVVDEYGGTSGFVTLEDVVEELVGEVADEHDPRRQQVLQNAAGAWVVPGSLRPDEIEEMTRLTVPASPIYETVGGFVMAALGRIPQAGDQVRAGDLLVTVESMAGRRIDRVRLQTVPVSTTETVSDETEGRTP